MVLEKFTTASVTFAAAVLPGFLARSLARPFAPTSRRTPAWDELMLSGSAAIVFWAMFIQVSGLDLSKPVSLIKEPNWTGTLWSVLLCISVSAGVVVGLRLPLNGFLRWMARSFPNVNVPLGDRSPWIIAMDRVGKPNTVKVVMQSGVIYIGSVDVAPQSEDDDSVIVRIGSTAMVHPDHPHRNTDPISFAEGTPVLAVLQKVDIAALEIFDHATEDAQREPAPTITDEEIRIAKANFESLNDN